ncbi:MFS transporter [Mongoliimonas terrestris]|uniref:MFS transporter n=1 Tax=Mongoliimonas terrestris TaxID=1709001 RepID=UPI000B016CB1|nr:MFS transporter [Mongoliimonas terrestris]
MPLFIRIGAAFFLNAFLLGSWLTRVPDVMETLGLSKAEMGLALTAGPIGTLAVLPFVGRWIDRTSPAAVFIASGIGLSLALLPIALAPNGILLTVAIFIAGVTNAGMEVAQNAAADRSEKADGRKVMARCHGFWSLGIMAGALVAGAAGQFGIGYGAHFPAVAAVAVLATVGLMWVLPPVVFRPPPTAGDAGEPGPVFALPGRAVLGACLMAIGVTLAEGAFYDWGTLFLRQDLGASPLAAGVGYACFAVAMAAGRFSGDAIRERFEAPVIVRACAVAAGIGLVGFVLAPTVPLACAALVVLGAGVSLVFPLAVSAVADRSGASAASNMAGLSLAVMAALLTAPPLIGFLAEVAGLGTAFLALLPAVVMTGFLAGHSRAVRTPQTLKACPEAA